MGEEQRRGRLSVVATPIGNLEDVTLRALRVLREADVILAEDTRRTRTLCARHDIHTRLEAYHAHSSEAVLRRWVDALSEGRHLALVTDAGTPLVSDPGAELVREAVRVGAAVESIPGASAFTAALSVAALPFDTVRFAGFAPRAGKRRRAWLEAIVGGSDASVFFEAPVRVGRTLAELAALAPEREAAVCRELTKAHEEVVRGTLAALADRFEGGARGEITVVVGGSREAPPAATEEEIDARIAGLLDEDLRPTEVARRVASETGAARAEVYARVQQLRKSRG